ncbi:MAG: hypothetical protein ACXWT1_08355 [Methylobacter sp.]
MPGISMVEHEIGDQFIHRRSITEHRNVGQRKMSPKAPTFGARPTHFNLHEHVAYDKLRNSTGAQCRRHDEIAAAMGKRQCVQ